MTEEETKLMTLIMFSKLRETGCEFGRTLGKEIEGVIIDMNGAVKKINTVHKLVWTILVSVIGLMGSIIAALMVVLAKT